MNNEESGCKGYTDQKAHRGRKLATIKKAVAENKLRARMGSHTNEKSNNVNM